MSKPGAIGGDVAEILMKARELLLNKNSPFVAFDLSPLLIGRGKTSFEMHIPADFADHHGTVHSAALTMVMDTFFGITAITTFDQLKPLATINLRSNYLQALAPGERIICEAEVKHIRSEIATVEGTLKKAEHGDLIATGSGGFMLGTRGDIKDGAA